MKEIRTINYMKQYDERKKVANLLQTGSFRIISTPRPAERNVTKNRVILVILAVFVFIIGLYSVFF